MAQRIIRWRAVRHHWQIYLFVIPTLVLLGLFVYYPSASGIFHSFYRWNGAEISEFVGFKNYKDILTTADFWRSFRVAVIMGFWNVVKMIPALAVAVCIHRCRSVKMQFFYRTLFVIPMVIPGLVVVLIWRSFFFEATTGFLNKFLMASGIFNLLCRLDTWFGWGGVFVPGTTPAWLGDPRLILTACVIWGFPWVGSFAVLTHLAKLQSISRDVYEAAEIDGVNWWTRFTKIELPLIMGSVYLLLVFVVIDTLKDAGMVLALAGMYGGPGGSANVPALFMLRKAFIEQQMGYACAIGIVLTILVVILQKILTWLLVGERTPKAAEKTEERPAPCDPAVMAAFEAKARKKHDWHMSPLGRTLDKIKEYGLRAGKHGFIWLVLVAAFLPLYLMIVVSFKDNAQFYSAPATPTLPLHPENWAYAWKMVAPSVANSLFLGIGTTALTLSIAIAAAYFFARQRMPLSGFLWNAVIIMMMMPMIANMVPLFRLLTNLRMLNSLWALILVGAASGQITAIFMFRTFVGDIPLDLYEAAEIDGASHFQQLKNVVLPLSGPILGTVGVQQFIASWNDFVLPLLVMRDRIRLPVMVQLLRMAGDYIKQWGPLMAGYALASIPTIILFVFTMKLFVRGLTEGAVKG
ncbi:MAG: ABC transporter permease subunit [Kiritimatiellia bacterium]|jgi:ABC-type glycerol-3-phosphate transport system permease component